MFITVPMLNYFFPIILVILIIALITHFLLKRHNPGRARIFEDNFINAFVIIFLIGYWLCIYADHTKPTGISIILSLLMLLVLINNIYRDYKHKK